jgi:Tol biopolymer transport system component/predicted Ser/Thr protein kinase
MTLPPGSKLGPYEVLSLLGAGGMGEVYRATDTRLNRTVAVKILPARLRDDPDRRQRFLREAQVVAALKHPHICVLHDISQHDGLDFLVMEYLEGETLADRLKKASLPLDQVMRFAIEIADALDKAHQQGIIHRDLKPGNIMLTKQGAKLLDFGLAKLRPTQGSVVAGVSAGLTQTSPLTGQGSILGTLPYMAPEQLEGKESDARTDIWAFGCTLHEMLTGTRAHEGKTEAGVIAAILEREVPSLIERQPSVPPLLDRILQRCLAKEPDERWQTAADLAGALRWITGMKVEAATAGSMRAARSAQWGWGVAAAAGFALVAIGVWMAMRPPASRSVSTARLTIQLPASLPLAPGPNRIMLAISPDGTRFAYVCHAARERAQICLRSIHDFEVTPLAGTFDASAPFFSPDGAWLGFHADGKLQKIAVAGSAPVVLADAPSVFSAAWASDNTIVYAPDTSSPLFRIPATGGAAAPVTTLDRNAGEWTHQWPHVLPDGAVLYTRGFGPAFDEFDICVFSPRTGRSVVLIRNASFPRYAASGHLLFWRRGTILAAPFDANRLELTGAAVPVVESVAGVASEGFALFALSESGSLLYVRGDPHGGRRTLMWVDRSGLEQPISAPPRSYASPRISPDGRRLAIIARDPHLDVWVYDFDRGTLARLTFDTGAKESAVWSPDGKWITYTASRPGGWQTLRRAFDGSGTEELLFENPNHQHWGSWAPDGKTLALGVIDPKTGSDIMIGSLDGQRSLRPLVRTPLDEDTPAFSPDGRWIAYNSQESGRAEVYVQAYPGPGGKWQVSTDGGTDPRWAKSGRELFYRKGDGVMAVGVETTPSFRVTEPRPFVERRDPQLTVASGWDVSPDGQRLLMMKNEDHTKMPSLDVVLNWHEELKQRVPIK